MTVLSLTDLERTFRRTYDQTETSPDRDRGHRGHSGGRPRIRPDHPGNPASATAAQPVQKQQGLGIFVQGGYIQSSTYGANGLPNMGTFGPKGGIIGIGFGGNKSGAFGVGVDLNYVFTSAKDVTVLNIGEAIAENGTLKSQDLDIPVYGRFNIGGHNTKNAPTFYIPAGWFFDILIKSDVDGIDVMNAFNGFSTGPLVGAGFEVARIGVEWRGMGRSRNCRDRGRHLLMASRIPRSSRGSSCSRCDCTSDFDTETAACFGGPPFFIFLLIQDLLIYSVTRVTLAVRAWRVSCIWLGHAGSVASVWFDRGFGCGSVRLAAPKMRASWWASSVRPSSSVAWPGRRSARRRNSSQ